jgi:hypothetical protein
MKTRNKGKRMKNENWEKNRKKVRIIIIIIISLLFRKPSRHKN